MAKVFDATLSSLINLRPEDWAAFFARLTGIPPGRAEKLDTDLATTVQADEVFRIHGTEPTLLHLELEANPRTGVPRDLWRYNTLADHKYDLPVETVLVLLRPKAAASDQTGIYRRLRTSGKVITEFHYHVERVWERPSGFWLSSGVGLAPLELLTDAAKDNPEEALDKLQECVSESNISDKAKSDVLNSSYVHCGLCYQPERIIKLFQRCIMKLSESTTYQLILSEGEVKGRHLEARAILLRQGTNRFGKPTSSDAAKLESTADLTTLENIADRIFTSTSWDELLAPL